MCICTIAGIGAGLALIVSGVRERLFKARNFPRWTLDTTARDRAVKAARTRKIRARLRYHLVAVNTAIEAIEWYRDASLPGEINPETYNRLVDKRAVIESVLYS